MVAGTLDAGGTTLSSLSSGAATLSSTLNVAGDVDVNSGKFAVTASDGSLAISSNKFTVAGDTGNTVVAGTLDAGGTTLSSLSSGAATLSSTLNVAGDVDVNSGKFAVTAASGDTSVGGTLSVTSNGVFSALLSVGVHSDSSKELYVNGDIYATGTSTSASDLRYKRDVEPVRGALDVVRVLNPITFAFKTESFPEKRFPETIQAGFIAQELESSLPHLVTADADGYLGVAYDRLGVYALAAMKELDDVVETERAARTALEQRVADLEARLARLEAREEGGGDARAHA